MSLDAAESALGSLHLAGPLSECGFMILFGIGPVFGFAAGVPCVVVPQGSDMTWRPFEQSAHANADVYVCQHVPHSDC